MREAGVTRPHHAATEETQRQGEAEARQETHRQKAEWLLRGAMEELLRARIEEGVDNRNLATARTWCEGALNSIKAKP